MQIFVNIAVTFVLSFWPVMFMMSPMMFDAPGSVNDKNAIVNLMLVMCYPVGLFFILGITGIHYFGISGYKLAAASTVIIAFAFSIFGYYGLLLNAIKGIASSGYSVVVDKVYFDGKPIQGVDSQTFIFPAADKMRSAYSYYARDKQHLYYRGKVVKDALAEDIHEVENSRGLYWHNNKQVLYDDKVLHGATPENFSPYKDFTGWARSDTGHEFNVFSYGKQLPTVDGESFAPLNDFYARDKNKIFFKDELILPGADAASFRLLSEHDFARDKNHVYYLSSKQPFIIGDADPASFEVFDRGYAKDKNNIFHVKQFAMVEKLGQADVASFEVTEYDEANRSEARDAKHYYFDGKIVGDR